MRKLRAYRLVLPYLAPHLAGLLFVTAISLASTALSLAQPYLTKLLIDDALLRRDLTALGNVALLLIAASALALLFSVSAGYWYTAISARVLFAMRRDLLAHLQTLPPRFHAEWKTGDVLSRLNNDISEIQRVVADSLLSIPGNLAFLVGSVVLLVGLDAGLFWVGVAAVPVALGLTWWLRQLLTDRVRELRERSADIGSFLLNTLLGHRVVAAFGAAATELHAFARRNEGYVRALLRMQWISYAGSGLPGFVLALSTAGVFWVGGQKVIGGVMTVGTLVAFLAYHARLLSPVQALMGLYTGLVTAQVSLERLEALFALPPAVVDDPGAQPLPAVHGEILLKQLSFRYHDAQPVLDNLDWHIPAGATALLLGPSGRGKSTLADLLLRFYEPRQGVIELDGRDLRQIPLADLRRHICVVEQTPWLFPVSVAENLRYGCPTATESQLREALVAVGLTETFPDLNVSVGERGLALSAGQRQRLAIARALLRRPAVLVLDEPTAALDEASEALVTRGVRHYLPHATLVIITHRLQLKPLATTILELS